MTVFFDIGSTLIEGPPSGPGKRLAAALGISDLPAVNRLLFRTHLEDPESAAEAFASTFLIPKGRCFEEIVKIWQAQLREAYVLPGAIDAVAKLREAGIPRGYISNIWPPFYQRFAQSFPQEEDCPQALSYRSGRMKPDLEFYREACNAAAVSPQDAVMIGDTYLNDIAPALELGMRTIWILHRPDKERCALARVINGEWPGPHRTLCSIADLTLDLL